MSRQSPGTRRRLALVALVGTVVIGALAAPAAGAQPADRDTTFVVAVDEGGDASVTLRLAFDLDRRAEREALERLRANRTEIVAEFRAKLESVAARTASETGREMRIEGTDVRVSTEDGTGTVELSATWVGLAEVDGDRLVLSDPFADGFTPPGRFEVRGPEGYTVAASTPEAATTTDGSATYAAGTSLDGFEAAFVPADASGGGSLPQPGFGFPAAIVAVGLLAGVSVLLARRAD